jgi:hypothetical protein
MILSSMEVVVLLGLAVAYGSFLLVVYKMV